MDHPESFWQFLKNLFVANDFAPQGHSYLWRPEIVWLHVISDFIIGFSYYSIPLAMIYIMRKRRDVPFRWMFVMFGAFILACGTTHFMNIVTVWDPVYRLDGVVKAVTALLSLSTAVALWMLTPKTLTLPSPTQLQAANTELQREITERKSVERKLRDSESLLGGLFDCAPDTIVLVNAAGRIQRVNRQAKAMFGYEPDELQSQQIEMLIPERYHQAHKQYHKGEVAKPREMGTGLDLYARRKDGSEFPADIMLSSLDTMNIKMVIGVVRDMTERKHAEQELARERNLLRSLIDNIPDQIYVKDVHGRFVLNNLAHARYLRANLDQVVGKTEYDFFPEPLAREYHAHDTAVVQSGQPLVSEEEPFPGHKADVLWFTTTRVPLRDPDGNIKGIVCLSRNVTNQKTAQEKLKKTVAELARSNAELQQFAYVASHDLQEPLRGVRSYLQLLEQRYKGKLDAEADDFIERAGNGAKRMQQLIGDLLAYSRVGTRQDGHEQVSCSEALALALSNLAAAIQENAASITHDPLPTVLGNGTQLTQLFQNLIGNSLKFRSEEPPRIHLSAQRHNGEWLFCVRDNGIGMNPEYGERVFLIFQRLHTRDEYPGTGIGLAICKKIVEGHGGKIWVESAPGAGATFYFTIPIEAVA